MLRRHRQLRSKVHRLLDVWLFAISLWIAHVIRDIFPLDDLVAWIPSIGPWFSHKLTDPVLSFDNYLWLYFVILPLVPVVLERQGFYDRPMLFPRRQIIWALCKTCIGITLLMIFAIYLSNNQALIARSVMILFGVIAFALVYLKEELIQWSCLIKFGKTQIHSRILLIGTPQDTCRLRCEVLEKHPAGIEIVREIDLNHTTIEEFVQALHEHSVNGVMVNAKHSYFGQVEKAIQACELEGVEAWLVADFFNTKISQTSFDEFHGRPVLVFHTGPEASWQGLFKQFLDFTGAGILLMVFSLPMLIAAIWIRLTSPGPIFFKQQRSGINGKPFTMFKFRTMVTNAEQRQQELAVLNEMSGPVFKITNDPRITPVGKWLRKFSIDEFPQLLNVLKGEMSLVGPRPLPVNEVLKFDDFAHRRRLSVKPGITCLWQVSGRNNVTDFKDWVRLDLEYIDNWSIWLDLKILFRTVPVVLLAKGAK
ncbi:MAG: sugar transferase [Verrucomicrobia bacterium]|nr:sugar transferase [Verrucomicrobiota bacterium]